MKNLFGETIRVEETTFEQDYQKYIGSAAWKRLRDAKIKQVSGRCEKCNKSKWSVRLEVHHLDYKHFKQERLEDLQVLCPNCHSGADQERVEETVEDRSGSAIIRGFENWMDRGNNSGWRRKNDSSLEHSWKQFLAQLSRRGKEYNIPYWRSPKW